MSVIYSEFRGVVSLYSNSILGASSEAINVAASSPGSGSFQGTHHPTQYTPLLNNSFISTATAKI